LENEITPPAFANLLDEKNFTQELLQNKLSSDRFCEARTSDCSVPKALNRPSLNVSPIKIISNGEFSGSKFVKSEITSNFYNDARRLGIPVDVVDSVINNLSPKVDFRRSLKRGDAFEIVYSQKNVMLYSKITTKYRQFAVYRFNQGANNSSYYFDNGEKVVARSSSNHFAQPLKGKLCVSSAFGRRFHPITGKRHYHSGVDFRVSYGAPVYAIFDGVVTRASRYYGYGNCIDIKHPAGYSSRYGHLSKFMVRSGARVKKGQLIGFTGSTGVSSGDHLHLELARNDRVLNPLSLKMIPGEAPTVQNRGSFQALKRRIERITAGK
jgi:murein DD-endopeptidase MepM/ murein hydrolase activator NlpD